MPTESKTEMSQQPTQGCCAQAVLRGAGDQFRIVGDFNPHWEYWRSPDGHFLYVSPSCERVTGYTREEFLQDPQLFSRIIHPDDRARVTAHQQEDLSLQELCELEFRIVRRDGQERWIGHACQPLLDAQGKTLGHRASNHDITQRKQAEAELRDQREWLRVTLSSIGYAVMTTDMAGRITFLNPVAAALTGWSLEEALNQPAYSVFRIVDEKSHGQAEDIVGRVLRERAIVMQANHTALLTRDGREIPIEDSVAPIKDSAGNMAGVVLVFHDVTEKRRAQEALCESREDLNRAQAVAHTGSWRMDVRHDQLRWSDETHRIFGIPKETPMTYETFLAAIHPEDRAYVDQQWRAALSGAPYDIEHRILVGGVLKWVRERANLEFDAAGTLLGGFGTVQDITEQKRADEALRHAKEELARTNENLEKLVQARTAQLQETVAELEHFSYTITHDLRAPLRTMRGFGSMLLEECIECGHAGRKDYLRRIANAAGRMDQLITDTLNYSKVVRQEQILTPVDPGAVLREIVESYSHLQPHKAVILIAEPLPKVLANEAGLIQCLSNLLGNAVKFVAEGKQPQVRVWAEIRESKDPQKREYRKQEEEPAAKSKPPASDENFHRPPTTERLLSPSLSASTHESIPSPIQPSHRVVRLWFEDNGIGIAKEHQDRIWGMFTRLDKSYEGTGIGLALVRKIVERMGGRVGVESEPGQGSRFWFELKQADRQGQ